MSVAYLPESEREVVADKFKERAKELEAAKSMAAGRPDTKTVDISSLTPFIKSKRNVFNILSNEGKYGGRQGGGWEGGGCWLAGWQAGC